MAYALVCIFIAGFLGLSVLVSSLLHRLRLKLFSTGRINGAPAVNEVFDNRCYLCSNQDRSLCPPDGPQNDKNKNSPCRFVNDFLRREGSTVCVST